MLLLLPPEKDQTQLLKNLNSALDVYSKYCLKWKLKINGDKSEAMFFTRFTSTRKNPRRQLKISNTDIPWKLAVKYLGLIIDKRLTFKSHIENTVIKCEKVFRSLYSLLNRKSKLNIGNKILLYTTIIRPIITYASPVWNSCAKTHKMKLQRTQNKFLKTILNVPPWFRTRTLHSICQVPSIEKFTAKIVQKFNTRFINSNLDGHN